MSNQKPISFDAYEKMAGYYFDYVDTKPYNAYYERPGTLALLPEVDGRRVLDAGCAAGWYTAWLLDRGAQVTALDVSPKMVEMTRRRVGDRADIRQADLNKPLDYLEEAFFDVVLSSLTLHYLKDWQQIMAEFFRVLKPGGKLVFSVHHPMMEYLIFEMENYFSKELINDSWSTPFGKVEVQFYHRPLQEIISPVLEAGFQLEALSEPIPTKTFRKLMPEKFVELTKRPQFLFIRAGKQ